MSTMVFEQEGPAHTFAMEIGLICWEKYESEWKDQCVLRNGSDAPNTSNSSNSSPKGCRNSPLLATEWTVGTLQTGNEATPIQEQVVDIFSMAERMAEEAAAAQEARKNPAAAAEQEEARRRAEGLVTRAEFVAVTEQLLSEIVRMPGDEEQEDALVRVESLLEYAKTLTGGV